MQFEVSENTKAILLLTAPLIVGRRREEADVLKPREYHALARRLHDLKREPADLLSAGGAERVGEFGDAISAQRLLGLLERGFLLSQALDQWHSHAIWVVSRADETYPQRLRTRLKEKAPPVVYGCGDPALLDRGGLAVVGSRKASDELLAYTERVGELAARSRNGVISGAAKGIDQAAMRGALEAGGCVVGIMADGLDRAVLQADHRIPLQEEHLTLISPFDPKAGFNAGNAMARNKYIYAFADAALVVNSDYNKGGTWSGAVEQLEKLRLVPVYVRSTGSKSTGLDELQKRGAKLWPTTDDSDEVGELLRDARNRGGSVNTDPPETGQLAFPAASVVREPNATIAEAPPDTEPTTAATATNPAEQLFGEARRLVLNLLSEPRSRDEIAEALGVGKGQADLWLKRMAEEDAVERVAKPRVSYARPANLFSSDKPKTRAMDQKGDGA